MRPLLAFVAIPLLCLPLLAQGPEAPKLYLESKSFGSFRDQSQEMAKDIGRDCPDVKVTTDRQAADYHLVLNHIQAGLLARDNQIAVTDLFGDVLSTEEKGSIKNGIKGACALILADWSDRAAARQRLLKAINAGFRKDGVMGYAEISGDDVTIHSERASAMRFRMNLASSRQLFMMQRAGIAKFIYTDDAAQKFVYDVKAGQIVSASGSAGSASPSPAQQSSPQ